jgi:hypothetical protein
MSTFANAHTHCYLSIFIFFPFLFCRNGTVGTPVQLIGKALRLFPLQHSLHEQKRASLHSTACMSRKQLQDCMSRKEEALN